MLAFKAESFELYFKYVGIRIIIIKSRKQSRGSACNVMLSKNTSIQDPAEQPKPCDCSAPSFRQVPPNSWPQKQERLSLLSSCSLPEKPSHRELNSCTYPQNKHFRNWGFDGTSHCTWEEASLQPQWPQLFSFIQDVFTENLCHTPYQMLGV